MSKHVRFSKAVSIWAVDFLVRLFWVFAQSGSVRFEALLISSLPDFSVGSLFVASSLGSGFVSIQRQYGVARFHFVWHVIGSRLCRDRSWMSAFMICFAIYISWLYCRICCDFRFVLYRPVWLNFNSLCYFRFGLPCGFRAIDLYDLLWFCSSILDFASRPKIGSCVTPPYALAQIWAEFWGD